MNVRRGGRPGRTLCFSFGSLSSRIILWCIALVPADALTSIRSGGRAGGNHLRSAGCLSGSCSAEFCRKQATAGGATSSLLHGCGAWRKCRHSLLPNIATSGLRARAGLAGRHPLLRSSLRSCSRILPAWRFLCRSCVKDLRSSPCCPFV